MGLNCSSVADLEGNEYLQSFCGSDPISPNDPIWNKLFSHSLKPTFTKDESFVFDSTLDNLRTKFLGNNVHSRNFTALIKVFTARADELKSSVQTGDTIFMWQTYNALFMIRHLCKYLVETMDEGCYVKQFQTLTTDDVDENSAGAVVEEGDTLEQLMDTLVKMLIDLPLQNNTYVIHLEAVNTIITLLSVQMFWARAAYKLSTFRIMMLGAPSTHAPQLTHVLLKNYIEQMEPPYSVWHSEEAGSIVIGMASGLWNILRKGVGLGKSDDVLEGLKQHNLANQSLYLLLILINHCTSGGGSNCFNPYREALVTFGNESGKVGEDGISIEAPLFKLSYSKLYEAISEHLSTDQTTLLLYFLIHRNNAFKSYVMARSDIEILVLPILKTLYNAPTSTSFHIYMSLIVMLILSEDQLFNQQVHDIMLKTVLWYTERKIHDISLGGLIILVIIRTIQYNMLKMRDKYLHTNCLAALANMSSKFRSLHPYVSQRLISVFETLAKRHGKLIDGLEKEPGGASSISKVQSDMVQDINVLEEVIRMFLEILNSVFTHQLPQNRHLVYTLLYKKDVFDDFKEYGATQDLVYNLDVVIKYFTKKIGTDSGELAVSEVMGRIEEGTRQWSPDILRKFPDLKFRYVEEDQPENFFIPYVWSTVYRNSGLYWSPINLTLFSLDGEYS